MPSLCQASCPHAPATTGTPCGARPLLQPGTAGAAPGTSLGRPGGQCGCRPWLCHRCPGGHFCHSGDPWGLSVHQSWKDFLNRISPCLSLSLGGGGVVFLSRYIMARRGAPQGHEACLGSLGRAGRRVSPSQWRWLRPPLTAASQHRCAPGPGPLQPLSRPVGWGTHGMGTAPHGWPQPAGPHARLADTTASSAGPVAQSSQARLCRHAAGAPLPTGSSQLVSLVTLG